MASAPLQPPLSEDSEWAAAMRASNFARAWQINDADLAARRVAGYVKHTGPRHLQHIWDGSPLDGKRVLVRCYHGLGDTLQFIRFAKPLRQRAREVIVWAQPSLLSMIRRIDGVDRAFPLHDGTPDIAFDVDIEVMELAHALRVTRRTLPRPPYLRSNGSAPSNRSGSRLAVGLCWQGGGWDARRNIPSATLARLRDVKKVVFLSLQTDGEANADLPFRGGQALSTIERLLEAMQQLDLVISVDTMTAHLAGAAGLDVWTLLIDDCDWRWPRRHTTTLWYPQMRLFHRPSSGQWEPLLDEVAASLGRRAAGLPA